MSECLRVYRPTKGRLYIGTPYRDDNRAWFRSLRIRAVREGAYWRISRSRFGEVVEESVARYGCAEVWTDHVTSQKCNPSCMEAKGDECICGCGGTNHGDLSDAGSYTSAWEGVGVEPVGDDLTRRYWFVGGAA